MLYNEGYIITNAMVKFPQSDRVYPNQPRGNLITQN